MFVVGVGVFTVASLAAGLSPNARWHVGARLLQGVGGGSSTRRCPAWSSSWSGAERGWAFGRLGTTIGISTAAGPVLGGVILAVAGK